MEKISKIKDRKNILESIKKELVKGLGQNLSCIIAYGSALCEDFYTESDFDILIFLHDPSFSQLKLVKKIKDEFKKKGIRIDFNIHSSEETPLKRQDCFWHNNRALYFQEEINRYGLILFGKNPFLNPNISEKELKKECVRVVNSLLYQTRKLMINSNMNEDKKIKMMKWCIYSVLYSLSFKGVMPPTKKKALEMFSNYYNLQGIEPLDFLNAKKKGLVNNELIGKAYIFLSELDRILFKLYKKKYGRI